MAARCAKRCMQPSTNNRFSIAWTASSIKTWRCRWARNLQAAGQNCEVLDRLKRPDSLAQLAAVTGIEFRRNQGVRLSTCIGEHRAIGCNDNGSPAEFRAVFGPAHTVTNGKVSMVLDCSCPRQNPQCLCPRRGPLRDNTKQICPADGGVAVHLGKPEIETDAE